MFDSGDFGIYMAFWRIGLIWIAFSMYTRLRKAYCVRVEVQGYSSVGV